MIIKGKSRAGSRQLGTYLDSPGENEHIEKLEIRGTVAQDVPGAINELDAYAAGTLCQKPLYHAMINPQPPNRLTYDQCREAVDALEEKLGFSDHPRVVVLHEKHGRQHLHVIWTRIDTDEMKAVHLGHNFRKHEEVARDLERRFGHDRVQGVHAERGDAERPDRTPSRAELRQEERTGIKGKDVKEQVTEAFRASDGPEAFCAALEDKGYQLAKGDRRDFVIVDRAGGIHSLARRIDDVNAAQLREFMSPLNRDDLPSIEEAKGIIEDRDHGTTSARDIEQWEDKLAEAAIKKAGEIEDEQKRRRQEAKDARDEAKLDAAYARGEDYVSQTRAALRDQERRDDALPDGAFLPHEPDKHVPPTVERKFADEAQRITERAEASQIPGELPERDFPIGSVAEEATPNEKGHDRYERMRRLLGDDGDRARSDQEAEGKRAVDELRVSDANRKGDDAPIGEISDRHAEMNEARHRRMQRLLNSEQSDERTKDHDDDPNRQPEAPGGGRTRSQ